MVASARLKFASEARQLFLLAIQSQIRHFVGIEDRVIVYFTLPIPVQVGLTTLPYPFHTCHVKLVIVIGIFNF